MKSVYLTLTKMLIGAFVIGLFFACEDEINTTGAGLVGAVNFEADVASAFSVTAYTVNYPQGVQTNGLPVGALGVYDDPVYGKTTASILTQLNLSRFDPDFGLEPKIDSVVFEMPYFSTLVEFDEDNNSIYELDSIFGDRQQPIQLSLYQSDFFLNDLDPDSGFIDPQIYFSNDINSPSGVIDQDAVSSNLLQVLLNADGTQNSDELEKLTSFTPSNKEIVLMTPELDDEGNIPENPVFEESERLSPRLRVKLDVNYWQQFIIDQQATTNLLNANSFNNYFRGLFIKSEGIVENAFYTLFDLTQTSIKIYYTFELGANGSTTEDSGEPDQARNDGFGDISLAPSGISFVDYINDFDPAIDTELDLVNNDTINGEANLYLKGGDGSLAIIDIFGPRVLDENGDEIQDELETLRSCGIIINEANLTFFVDQEDAFNGLGETEPERLFMYDIDNNGTLADGVLDGTGGGEGPIDSRTNHLGRLTRTEVGNTASPGISYRIRLTQHLNDVINNDFPNVRLGLSVSQNVTVSNTSFVRGTGDLESGLRVPVASVVSPEGTIIHGNLSDNSDKKLKLRIFYTLTEEIDPDSPCGQLLGL